MRCQSLRTDLQSMREGVRPSEHQRNVYKMSGQSANLRENLRRLGCSPHLRHGSDKLSHERKGFRSFRHFAKATDYTFSTDIDNFPIGSRMVVRVQKLLLDSKLLFLYIWGALFNWLLLWGNSGEFTSEKYHRIIRFSFRFNGLFTCVTFVQANDQLYQKEGI